VSNPKWHYTAHRLDNNRTLLTLFNFASDHWIGFDLTTPTGWTIRNTVSTKEQSGQWRVAPRSVGFVIMTRQ
jgi:hypothetical protein